VKARSAGARVVEAAVDAAVAGRTAARVAVARLDAAASAVEAGRRAAGVEELTRVAEVRRRAAAAERVGRHADARASVLTVGARARARRLAALAVVPRRAHAPASPRIGRIPRHRRPR